MAMGWWDGLASTAALMIQVPCRLSSAPAKSPAIDRRHHSFPRVKCFWPPTSASPADLNACRPDRYWPSTGADEVDPHFQLIKGGGLPCPEKSGGSDGLSVFVVVVECSKCER